MTTLARLTFAASLTLALGATGCIYVEENDDDTESPGNDGPSGGEDVPAQACVVGTWSFSGPTGTGDCYPYTSVNFGNTVRFEQRGSDLSATLLGADANEYIVDGSYLDTGAGCQLSLEVHLDGEYVQLTTLYTLQADLSGYVHGNAQLIGEVDGSTCFQQFEVMGLLE